MQCHPTAYLWRSTEAAATTRSDVWSSPTEKSPPSSPSNAPTPTREWRSVGSTQFGHVCIRIGIFGFETGASLDPEPPNLHQAKRPQHVLRRHRPPERLR